MPLSVLHELFRHKTWATLRLIEFCQSLPAEYQEATQSGTYGSVRQTLIHLANAETGYHARIAQAGASVRLSADASLDDVAQRIRELGPGWEALLDDPDLPERIIRRGADWSKAVAPMAQAIHHADDYRTQVLSILGARGIDVPELDLWAFGTESGYVGTDAAPAQV